MRAGRSPASRSGTWRWSGIIERLGRPVDHRWLAHDGPAPDLPAGRPGGLGRRAASRDRRGPCRRRRPDPRSATGSRPGSRPGCWSRPGIVLVNLIGVESVRHVFVARVPDPDGPAVPGARAGRRHDRPRRRHGRGRVVGRRRSLACPPTSTGPSWRGSPAWWPWRCCERVAAPAFDQTGIEKDWLYSKQARRPRMDRRDRRVHHRGRSLSACAWGSGSTTSCCPIAGRSRPRRPWRRPPNLQGEMHAEREPSDDDEKSHPLGRRRARGRSRSSRGSSSPGLLAVLPYLVGPVVSRILGLGRHLPAARTRTEHRGRATRACSTSATWRSSRWAPTSPRSSRADSG